jgi:hypothetical protein
MSRIRLYFDEDAMQHALVVALRARRVDVLTASSCGMVNRNDEEHLRHANSDGRVLQLQHPRLKFAARAMDRQSFWRPSSVILRANNCGGFCTF